MFKKNKEIKMMALVALGLSVVGIMIAGIAMNVSLNAKKTESVWDINFTDLAVENKGTAEAIQPTMNATSMSNFKTTLMRTGDSTSYKFKIKNNGAVNARLKVMSEIKPTCMVADKDSSTEVCSDVSYNLTYNDGSAVSTGDVISAGTSKEVILKVEYLGANLTNVEVSNLDFILLFEQV